MAQKLRRTDKQKMELATEICDAYADGVHTIDSCCEQFGVSSKTWQNWSGKEEQRGYVAEIAKIYEKAKIQADGQFKDRLKVKAKKSLERIIEGYETEDVKTIIKPQVNADGSQGKHIVVEIIKHVKHVAPNTTAIIFSLTNTDPTNFRHRQDISHSGGVTLEKVVMKLPDGSTVTI